MPPKGSGGAAASDSSGCCCDAASDADSRLVADMRRETVRGGGHDPCRLPTSAWSLGDAVGGGERIAPVCVGVIAAVVDTGDVCGSSVGEAVPLPE